MPPARNAKGQFIGAGYVAITADTSAVDKQTKAMSSRLTTSLRSAARIASRALLTIPKAFLAGMREAIQAAAATLSAFSSKARGIIGRPISALRTPAGFLVGAAGLGGAAIAIKKVVVAASDLNEAINKVEVVFGEASRTVIAGADEMAKRFGVPKKQFIDSASSLGLIAKAAGLSQQKAAELGVQFARLGADAASFYNVPLEEALVSMRAGLVGESEPLRRFGVLLNEDAVKAEILRQNLNKGSKEITEGMKVQARAALILKGMTDAQGDLARTSDALANRLREVWGRIQNLAAAIGQFLLPAAQALTRVFSEMVQGVEASLKANAGTLHEWGQALKRAAEFLGVVYRNFSKFKEIGKLAFADLGKNLMAVFKSLTTNLVNWADYLGKVIGEAIKEGLTSALAGTALGKLLGINKAVAARAVPRPQFVAPQFAQNPRIDAALRAIERAELGRAAVEAGKQAMGRVGEFGRKFLVFMNEKPAVVRNRGVRLGQQGFQDAEFREHVQELRDNADRLRQGGRVPKRNVERAEEKAQKAERAQHELDLADEGIPLDVAAQLGDKQAKQRIKEAPTRDRFGRIVGVAQEEPRFQSQYHGLEDFAKTIQLGALNGQGEDPAKRTAKNTERTADAMEKLAARVGDGNQLLAVAMGPA